MNVDKIAHIDNRLNLIWWKSSTATKKDNKVKLEKN